MNTIKRVIVGIEADPQLVAAVRAVLLYLVPIAAELAVAWLNSITDPRFLAVIPATITLIRVLEGTADRKLKPTQNAAVPTPPAGAGAPVDHISADK